MDIELSELFSIISNKGLFLCARNSRNYVNVEKKNIYIYIYFNLIIDPNIIN